MPKKITLRYLILAVVHYCGLNLTSAMFTTFLLSRGLDERMAMVVYAMYFLALTTVEIPTGASADIGGRKNAFMISCVFSAASMVGYAYAQDFYVFALAAIGGGIGAAFANGTLDSWFVTQLKNAEADNGSLDLAFTKADLWKTGVSAFAGFVGIKFAGETMQIPWFASALCFLIVGVLAALLMHESEIKKRERLTWEKFRGTAREALDYGRGNRRIRFVVFAAAALYGTVMIPNMLWQPHFLKWLPGKEVLGYIWIAMMVANAFGNRVVWEMRRRGAEIYDRRTMLICLMLIGIGIFGTGFCKDPLDSLLFFMLYQGARGAYQPINKSFLHRHIADEEMRTTVSSIEAIGHHVGAALGLFVGAVIVYSLAREMALILAGSFIFFFAVLWWRHRKRS